MCLGVDAMMTEAVFLTTCFIIAFYLLTDWGLNNTMTPCHDLQEMTCQCSYSAQNVWLRLCAAAFLHLGLLGGVFCFGF